MHWIFLALLMATGDRVKPDERVVLFPTLGARDGDGYRVFIHGWIHEPETDSIRRRALLRSVREWLDVGEGEASTIFERRASGFVVDNERGKRIAVRIAGDTVVMPESDAGGHFEGTAFLPDDDLRRALGLAADAPVEGALPIEVDSGPDDARVFGGTVHVVPPTGLSVVSDIDDTLKRSDVLDRRALLRRTFQEEFEAIPGMADLLTALSPSVSAFHYVSASPWQLSTELEAFLVAGGFPSGSLHLRRLRAFDRSFLELFQDPLEYKNERIAALLRRFPERRFVLIGDSTESDPECFAGFLRDHPDRIPAVAIRRVGDVDPTAGLEPLDDDLAERLIVFDDPATAAASLRALVADTD